MNKRKVTIELDDATIAMIERVKKDSISIEEAIDGLLHMGLLEVIKGQENPIHGLLSELKGFMDGMPDIKTPKANCGVMRMNSSGEIVEVDRKDLPEELLNHVTEIEKAFSAGLSAGKDPEDIMKELGLARTMEEAMNQRAAVVTDGNLVHFPTNVKPS